MTKDEIIAKYKQQHYDLKMPFYGKKRTVGVTPEEQATFDLEHGQIWNNMEAELIAGGYIIIPEPPRDLEAEIDELKVKVKKLEEK